MEALFTDYLDDVSGFFNLSKALRIKAITAFALFYTVIALFGVTAAATFSTGELFYFISGFILLVVCVTIANIWVLIIYPDDIKLQKRVTLIVLIIAFVLGFTFGVTLFLDLFPENQFHSSVFWIYFSIWLISFALFQYAIKLFNRVTGAVVEQRDIHELELNLARKLQQQLLPDIFAKRNQLEIHGQTVLASEVGGDYFDMAEHEGRLYVVIGDVSGHGMAAGMLMATLKSSFLTEIKYNRNLNEVIQEVNKHVCTHSDKKMFITFAILELNLSEHTCTIVNAGHLPILFKKNGAIKRIKPKGLALGVTPHTIYELITLPLEGGEEIVMITDGFTEARNHDGEEWTMEGVESWWDNRSGTESPKQITDALIKEMNRFSGQEFPTDDASAVCVAIRKPIYGKVQAND